MKKFFYSLFASSIAISALILGSCSALVEDLKNFSGSASYTVVHMQEIVAEYDDSGNQTNFQKDSEGNFVLDDEGNPVPVFVEAETEKLFAEPGELSKAVQKQYEGFTALAFEQKEVTDDGLTQIEIKYVRNESSVTLDLNGGFWNYAAKKAGLEEGDSEPKVITKKFGSEISDKEWPLFTDVKKTAAEFAGWIKDSEEDIIEETKDNIESLKEIVKTLPAVPVKYSVKWNLLDGVAYTVEHYQEKADSEDASDDNNYELFEVDSASDRKWQVEESGDMSEVTANSYEGFTLREEIVQQVVETTPVNPKLSDVVVKVYYKRNICKITLNPGEGCWNYAETKTGGIPEIEDYVLEGKFGAKIDYSSVPLAGLGKKSHSLDYWQIGDSAEKVSELPETFADYSENGTKYTAIFVKAAEVGYKVEHWFEKTGLAVDKVLAEEDFVQNLEKYPDDELSGVPEDMTEAAAKTVTGFTSLAFEQAEIVSSGETVVKIFYKRNISTVTLKIGSTEAGEESACWNYKQWKADKEHVTQDLTDKTYTGKFENALECSVLDGSAGKRSSVLTGWKVGETEEVIESLPATFPAESVGYTAQWAEGDSVKYTVQHWFEKVNAENVEVESDVNYAINEELTDVKTGKVETNTEAAAKSVEGFTNRSFSQVEIGSTGAVVKIYYTRNQVTVTLSAGEGGAWNYPDVKATSASPDTEDKTVIGKYGYPVDYAAVPFADLGKKSWEISGWKNGSTEAVVQTVPAAFPIEDTTFTAQWHELDPVNYTVEHWFEKIDAADVETETDANYEINSQLTETKSGKVEETTEAAAKSVEGFTSRVFEQKEIEKTGTTVKIFYARNTVKITLKAGEGGAWNYPDVKATSAEPDVTDRSVTGKFGRTISYAGIPLISLGKRSNGVSKWQVGTSEEFVTGLPVQFPAADTAFTAIWAEKSVDYTVKHWFEKTTCVDSSVTTEENYELNEALVKTETLTGVVETNTKAASKTVTGFTAKEVKQAEILDEDNNPSTIETVVNVYYVRNPYDIVFKTNEGVWNFDAWKADKEHVLPNSENKTLSGKFGTDVDYTGFEDLKKTGMNLTGWKKESSSGLQQAPGLPSTFQAENQTYVAQWKDKDPVAYTVKFMTENLDSLDDSDPSNYTEHSQDTTKKGIPDYYTEATAKAIAGFTAKEIVQQEIKEDGSTVVSVYYTRNTYKITFQTNGGLWNYEAWKADKTGVTADTADKHVEGKFGSTVDLSTISLLGLGKTSHDQNGWIKNGAGDPVTSFDTTYTSSDVVYSANWVRKSGVTYQIKHWAENVGSTNPLNHADSNYTVKETTEGFGVPDEETEAMPRTYEGFEAETEPAIEQKVITKDGKTVVNIYYHRNSYNFIFDPNGGSITSGLASVSGKYESAFNKSNAPVVSKTGWTFGGWKHDGELVSDENKALTGQTYDVAEDKTYTAYWISTASIKTVTTFGDIVLNKVQDSSGVKCSLTLPAGYESETWTYKWYVDGGYDSNEAAFNRTNEALGRGVHTITVKAQMRGQTFTSQVTATIE